jgi:hypothetical protein
MCTLARDGVSKSNGLNLCEPFSYMVGFLFIILLHIL